MKNNYIRIIATSAVESRDRNEPNTCFLVYYTLNADLGKQNVFFIVFPQRNILKRRRWSRRNSPKGEKSSTMTRTGRS